jgi:hypothetical protein
MIIRRAPTGLGQGPSGQQIAGTVYGAGASIATPIAGAALATAVAIPASLAIPIVGAAFAGIWLGIEALLNSGCGNTCVVTSNWANQAESLLKQNLAAYQALPTPRAESAQAAYLQNFDKVWAYLVQECSQPQVGTAGQRCISDRQAGACHYHDSTGQCWNWFTGYRDPIANDPNVVPDSAASQVSGAVAGAVTGAAGSLGMSPWLLAGVALLVVGLGVAAASS